MLQVVEHSSKEEPFGGYTSFMLVKDGVVYRQYNIINVALKVSGVRFGIIRNLVSKVKKCD